MAATSRQQRTRGYAYPNDRGVRKQVEREAYKIADAMFTAIDVRWRLPTVTFVRAGTSTRMTWRTEWSNGMKRKKKRGQGERKERRNEIRGKRSKGRRM